MLVMVVTAWFGCLKDISNELPKTEPKITVNGFITPTEWVRVFITQSRGSIEPVGDNYLYNAKAYIYEDDQLVDSLIGGPEIHVSLQLFTPQIGKNYRIEVSMPGFKSVTASTSIPNYVPIQSIQLDTVFYPPTGHNTYVLRIKINDPPAVDNYYHLLVTRLRLNPQGDWDPEQLCYESDDIVFESLAKEYCIGGTFSDASFNGLQKEIAINTKRRISNKLKDSLQFVVELRNGSKPYFDYNKSLIIFKNNQWDIFTQPAPVNGNVNEGYGVFAGYAPVIDTVKLN